MTPFAAVEALRVFLLTDPRQPPIPVGRMAWSGRQRASVFEYDAAFLASGLELSPFRLPLGRGGQLARSDPFEGLHGLFADSLPDGWGRRLTDRRLVQDGIDPGSLTPVDRLSLIGQAGMGALTYAPDRATGPEEHDTLILDQLYAQAARADRDDAVADLVRLERLNGGSTGARPKAMIHVAADGRIMTSAAPDREAWLVKFASRSDPPDSGAVEAAYAEMARLAGLQMPPTRFVPSEDGSAACTGYFMVQRFDRQGLIRRHVHTASGLLHADHRVPSLTYEDLLTLTRKLTGEQRQVDEQFRRAAFNVLAGNRDDHARNHAFVLDLDRKRYMISPAYDLTPSTGMGGEHALTINGRGKDIGPADLQALARHGALPARRASAIIDEVIAAIGSWPRIAERLPMGKPSRTAVGARLDLLLQPFGAGIPAG
jgi:serine/threonine-protein kinase HipA